MIKNNQTQKSTEKSEETHRYRETHACALKNPTKIPNETS